MFIDFFLQLKEAAIPVSVREYLVFLEALDRRVIESDAEGFYYLARTALVKDRENSLTRSSGISNSNSS